MINKFKSLISKVISPKEDNIVVNMDGGVGGSWSEVEYIEVNGQKLQLQQSELPELDL